jgi:hypothetical protein
LDYAASELGHLLVGEMLDGEARLLELVTDIHGGQDGVDRRSQFGQRVADQRVIEQPAYTHERVSKQGPRRRPDRTNRDRLAAHSRDCSFRHGKQ